MHLAYDRGISEGGGRGGRGVGGGGGGLRQSVPQKLKAEQHFLHNTKGVC